MPRIYDSASNPIDFCKRCFPKKSAAEKKYGNVAMTGEGPDGRGNCFDYQSDHPSYEDMDYTCDKCGKALTSKDN